MPLFCQPGNAEHLSIWLKGPLEGCCTVAASLSGTELPRVPLRPRSWPPPRTVGAHAAPGPLGPCPPAAPPSPACGCSGARGSQYHLLPLGSTLGYLHPALGGEPKPVKLYLQLVPGGELQIWPPGPMSEPGESRPAGLRALRWDCAEAAARGGCSGHPASCIPGSWSTARAPSSSSIFTFFKLGSWSFGSFSQ